MTGCQCSHFFLWGCTAAYWSLLVIGQVLKPASVTSSFLVARSRLLLVVTSCLKISAGCLTFLLQWSGSQETCVRIPTMTLTCSVTLDKPQLLWMVVFLNLQNSQGFYHDYHVFIVLIKWHVLTTLDVLCHLDQTITSIYKRGNWQREGLSSQIF